jgi:hypothetical protein
MLLRTTRYAVHLSSFFRLSAKNFCEVSYLKLAKNTNYFAFPQTIFMSVSFLITLQTRVFLQLSTGNALKGHSLKNEFEIITLNDRLGPTKVR